jgi:hypothetical protein
MKEIKMTNEIAEKLYGLMPMSAGSVVNFTPSEFDELEEELRPVFKIKQMTQDEVDKVKEVAVKDLLQAQSYKDKKTTSIKADKIVKMAKEKEEHYLDICESCIVGWSNMFERTVVDDGVLLKEIEYRKDTARENLANVPFLLPILYQQILKVSGLGV